MSVAPFAMMFGVIYFLMIRPQQKRLKDQQEMIGALKDGDEVLTASGILGKITGIAEKVVTLEVAQNVRIKILKSQVSQVIKGQIKDLA
ncbi:MAG: preprotein translocase subunit YajC [Bdellovibrionales bacterium]|nr:preprotein translocase subunit YajC [Bdellovibrionales bacterium]